MVSAHGGQVSAGGVSKLYAQRPGCKVVVDGAGGLKKFCEKHRQLEFVPVEGGDGFVQRSSQSVAAPTSKDSIMSEILPDLIAYLKRQGCPFPATREGYHNIICHGHPTG